MTACGSRYVRGWVCAGLATAIAAASHVFGGGEVPNLLLLLFSLSVSGLVCCLLTGRVLSLSRLIAAVVTSQALFHWLFSLTPMPPSDTSQMMMAGTTHGEAGVVAITGRPTAASITHALEHGWQIWLGHAVAAVLTILVLRCGETTTIRLLEALRLKITAFLRLVVVRAPAPCRLRPGSTSGLLPRADLGVPLPVMRYRGPPLPLAAS